MANAGVKKTTPAPDVCSPVKIELSLLPVLVDELEPAAFLSRLNRS
jgi:hypothetical protein